MNHKAYRLAIFSLLLIVTAAIGVAAAWLRIPNAHFSDKYVRRPAGSLTFCRDIAPIIIENCADCHRPGESAPFDLLSYQDVKIRPQQIVAVTQSRFMPPWLPEPNHGEFADTRRLTPDEIGMIQQWATEGAKEGDPSDMPPRPKWTRGWQLGEPDLVVQMPQPFTLPAEGPDVFRNFVIRISLAERKYVRSIEFRPGNAKIVHHAVILVDRTRESRRLDQDDPLPGFDGMISEHARSPDGHFLGWTPGKMPIQEDSQLSWRLDSGTDLVLLLHMQPTGKPEVIQSTLGIHFADQPPTKTPHIIRLGTQTIDIPAGDKHHVVQDTYRLPIDVDALGIYPHAHYLCKKMKAFAVTPEGTKKRLFLINDWDINWQDEYRFVEPVHLPQGTVVTMRYVYDNSTQNVRNPHQPPERVYYGPQATDEMGELWIQVLPRRRTDLAILKRDLAQKETHAALAGHLAVIERDPQNAKEHARLAMIYNQLGNIDLATSHLQESLRIDPASCDVNNNLGNILQRQGHLQSAIRHYRRALRLNPHYAKALNNLGLALRTQGKYLDAIDLFEQAVAADAEYAPAHNNLANMLGLQGQDEQAVEHFRQALKFNPDYVIAHHNLANLLRLQGDYPAAIHHYRQALALRPSYRKARECLEKTLRLKDASRASGNPCN